MTNRCQGCRVTSDFAAVAQVAVPYDIAVAAVADRPRQVNKIIGYLQVFPGNSCFLRLSNSCFEIFPPFSRQDDKSVVYVMLERSEASFYLNCRV